MYQRMLFLQKGANEVQSHERQCFHLKTIPISESEISNLSQTSIVVDRQFIVGPGQKSKKKMSHIISLQHCSFLN